VRLGRGAGEKIIAEAEPLLMIWMALSRSSELSMIPSTCLLA